MAWPNPPSLSDFIYVYWNKNDPVAGCYVCRGITYGNTGSYYGQGIPEGDVYAEVYRCLPNKEILVSINKARHIDNTINIHFGGGHFKTSNTSLMVQDDNNGYGLEPENKYIDFLYDVVYLKFRLKHNNGYTTKWKYIKMYINNPTVWIDFGGVADQINNTQIPTYLEESDEPYITYEKYIPPLVKTSSVIMDMNLDDDKKALVKTVEGSIRDRVSR